MAENFHEDIWKEIFSRLPVKSLMRCKLVCKRWLSLISERGFPELHLQRLKAGDLIPSQRIVVISRPLATIYYEALDVEVLDGNNDCKVVSHRINRLGEFWGLQIVGSCDGLVCLSVPGKFLIYNPTTREYRDLSGSDLAQQDQLFHGFGYDSPSDDYKIVQGGGSEKLQVAIYSLKSGSWKRLQVQQESHLLVSGRGVYWKGALHWRAVDWNRNKTVIMSFDLSEEKFHQVLSVSEVHGDIDGLGIHGANLFIYRASNPLFEAWITNEYRGGGSWTKLFSVLTGSIPGFQYGKIPLAYTRSGKIVFQIDKDKLILFNPNDDTKMTLYPKDDTWKDYTISSGRNVDSAIYLETLVSPKRFLSNGRKASLDEEPGYPGKKMRTGISASIIDEIKNGNLAFFQRRQKRQIPSTLAPVEDVERYTQLSSYPLHKTGKPGITSLDICHSKDIIATGGIDTSAVLFDLSSGQIMSTLSGHSKKVTSVKFDAQGDLVLTGSADKTVRVWQGSEDGSYNCRHILKDHTAEVQAITVHATNNYFATASLDNTWCFYEFSTGLCLTQVEGASGSEGYTSAAFHPNGIILGTGTSNADVKIWDVRTQANVATFSGHTGAITAISFFEKIYFVATAAEDGVKLWDLRKLKNFCTFSAYDKDTGTNSFEFDHSGCYLALAGSDIRVYQVASVKSEWNCIKTFPDLSGTGKLTCVKFGPDSKYIAVGSMDHNLRIFGLPSEDGSMES